MGVFAGLKNRPRHADNGVRPNRDGHMSSFQYEAYNHHEQRRVSGLIDAETLQEARRLLMKQDLVPIEVLPAGSASLSPAASVGLRRLFRSNKTEDRIAFTRGMATMMGAGLPVTTALQNQVRFAKSAALKRVCARMRDDVLAGKTLTQALEAHPDYFDRVYVGIVSAGERSGELEEVLLRLADLLRRKDGVWKKFREMMLYPLFTIAIWLGVLSVMLQIVPLAVSGMTAAHMDVPLPLQILQSLQFILIPGLILCGMGVIQLYRWVVLNGPLKGFQDEMLWSLPKVGDLIDLTACEHFISTLRVAHGAGMSLVDAVELAVESIGHLPSRQAYRAILPAVESGRPLIEGIVEVPYIPDVVMQILAAGEEAGTLEKVLDASEAYLKDEITHTVEVVLKLIHFLTLLLLAGLVGCFLMAFYGILFGGIFGSIAGQISDSIPPIPR